MEMKRFDMRKIFMKFRRDCKCKKQEKLEYITLDMVFTDSFEYNPPICPNCASEYIYSGTFILTDK